MFSEKSRQLFILFYFFHHFTKMIAVMTRTEESVRHCCIRNVLFSRSVSSCHCESLVVADAFGYHLHHFLGDYRRCWTLRTYFSSRSRSSANWPNLLLLSFCQLARGCLFFFFWFPVTRDGTSLFLRTPLVRIRRRVSQLSLLCKRFECH